MEHENAIEAQATVHHAYFQGLQLMVASRETPRVVGDWMFRLFRQQHEENFLASFDKLGLSGLPDAVACARYHVLSNSIGGVPVEYAEESPQKAWVRFRYPRWMFDGPTLCGMPVEASSGFLRGWYAHNGVSLNNRRLGFVCVSQDMTGEFGFCGYFQEYDHDLKDAERLRYAENELPPPFDPAAQLTPPAASWSRDRLLKANRNYAVAYVRNGVTTLIEVLGRERGRELASLAARLTGLQYFQAMRSAIGAADGDYCAAAEFLAAMFEGMGDEATVDIDAAAAHASVTQRGLRIVRGLDGAARDDLLSCWCELWLGAVHSHQSLKSIDFRVHGNALHWRIADREA